MVYFLVDRKRVTFVPQTGQTPCAILRPLVVSLTVPFLTFRFVRHLTQYASNSMFFSFRLWMPSLGISIADSYSINCLNMQVPGAR